MDLLVFLKPLQKCFNICSRLCFIMECFKLVFLRHDIFGNIIHKTDAHISVKDYLDYNDR